MIGAMPRGGPDASWLDRHLQTSRPEYLDRDDVPDERKQKIAAFLDRAGERTGHHNYNAHLTTEQLSGIPNPRILELGAGHGGLSARVVDLRPTAEVTVTDLDPVSVADIEAGPLGTCPRVTAEVADATAIDAPDDSYDLVVFAMSFHHLPPSAAYRSIAEGTRVGKEFLVIDLKRPPAIVVALAFLLVLPAAVFLLAHSSPSAVAPILHDAYISLLRSYSTSAFIALAAAADPTITVEFPATRRQVAVVYTKP
ncbi:class I SAM-dependent methyltransferase [Nocardia brevicatena]|uniref:class I SAM-dependent methyltransferase n=1 Tax=Nocardia brevicatena TaxID=37327 RepID=UPI0005946EC8|nr:class I SAM-dependent methyltransferase [Nocardia brevicatena]